MRRIAVRSTHGRRGEVAMNIPALKLLVLALATGCLAVAFRHRAAVPDDAAPTPPIVQVEEGWPATALLRSIAKQQIAEEVAAGRRTVWEAAALFRDLNRVPPQPHRSLLVDACSRIPADTDEGWECRGVIAHVRVVLHPDTARADAVAARLEADVLADLRARGAIRLPDSRS